MYLNGKTKKILEKTLGLSLAEISGMTAEEEKKFVKTKSGAEPYFSKIVDKRINGRGNPLLSRRKICTLEDVNTWLRELR